MLVSPLLCRSQLPVDAPTCLPWVELTDDERQGAYRLGLGRYWPKLLEDSDRLFAEQLVHRVQLENGSSVEPPQAGSDVEPTELDDGLGQLDSQFASCDSADGNGELNTDGVRQLCKMLHKKIDNKTLARAFREMDKDCSGAVDIEEFRSWWQKGFQQHKSEWATPPISKLPTQDETMRHKVLHGVGLRLGLRVRTAGLHVFAQEFLQYDLNHDGLLDGTEFKAYLKAVGEFESDPLLTGACTINRPLITMHD